MENKHKYLKLLAFQYLNGEMTNYQNIWCYIQIDKSLLDSLIKFKSYIPKFRRDTDLLSIKYRIHCYPYFIEMTDKEKLLYDGSDPFVNDFYIQFSIPKDLDLFEGSIEKLDSYKFIFQNGYFCIQGIGKYSGVIYETEQYSIKDIIKNIKNLVK